MSAVDYLDEAEWSLGCLDAAMRDLRTQMEQGNVKTQMAASLDVRRHARRIIDRLGMLDFVVRDTAEKLKIVK